MAIFGEGVIFNPIDRAKHFKNPTKMLHESIPLQTLPVDSPFIENMAEPVQKDALHVSGLRFTAISRGGTIVKILGSFANRCTR
jgi:hypothetical protein